MSKRKKLIFVAAIIIVFAVVALFAGTMRNKYVVPILMYHRVLPNPRPDYKLAVSVKAFERQMRFLKEEQYKVLPLEKLLDLLKKKEKIPARTVAITFDDGYIDNYIYAFPILKKYNLPATIFVIINEVGRLNQMGKLDRISWDQIKRMQDTGLVAFGSHALGPDPLTKIASEDDLKKEIYDSKRILSEKLGREVVIFSYPEGRFSDKIRQLVIDAGYKGAVATNPGKNYANDDIFALKRLKISPSSSNLFVFWVEISGYYNFMREHRHK